MVGEEGSRRGQGTLRVNRAMVLSPLSKRPRKAIVIKMWHWTPRSSSSSLLFAFCLSLTSGNSLASATAQRGGGGGGSGEGKQGQDGGGGGGCLYGARTYGWRVAVRPSPKPIAAHPLFNSKGMHERPLVTRSLELPSGICSLLQMAAQHDETQPRNNRRKRYRQTLLSVSPRSTKRSKSKYSPEVPRSPSPLSYPHSPTTRDEKSSSQESTQSPNPLTVTSPSHPPPASPRGTSHLPACPTPGRFPSE